LSKTFGQLEPGRQQVDATGEHCDMYDMIDVGVARRGGCGVVFDGQSCVSDSDRRRSYLWTRNSAVAVTQRPHVSSYWIFR